MSILLRPKYVLAAFGLSSILGISSSPESQTKLRIWLLEMHAHQIELLKIDWGQPGLCTEWDRDYDPKTRSCGRRGKLTERRSNEFTGKLSATKKTLAASIDEK